MLIFCFILIIILFVIVTRQALLIQKVAKALSEQGDVNEVIIKLINTK